MALPMNGKGVFSPHLFTGKAPHQQSWEVGGVRRMFLHAHFYPAQWDLFMAQVLSG